MNHGCNEVDFRLVICWARVAKKYHYDRASTIVVISAAASSTENSIKENFFDVQGDTALSNGKKGNTPCRNMDVLWTWTEGGSFVWQKLNQWGHNFAEGWWK